MRGQAITAGGPMRRVVAAVVGLACVLAAGSALAAAHRHRHHHAHRVYRAGAYEGQVNQSSPAQSGGLIDFVVDRGQITGLQFTVGTECGSLWAVDEDHAVPTFPVNVDSTGAFSFTGTVGGRFIQLQGTLRGDQAQGTFFQAFTVGQLTCTMGQAASFSATG